MFESGKRNQEISDLAGWACISGLRYLRMHHPLKAEHDFAQMLYFRWKLQEMIAAGEIAASDTHNTIRPSVWGIARHVTILPQEGAGRSWPESVPEQFSGFPTIEIPPIELGSVHYVRDMITALSRALPRDLSEPNQLLLSEIEKESQPDVTVHDLNALAPQPPTKFISILLAGQASMLMDLLDQMAPLYTNSGPADPELIRNYWNHVSTRYAHWLINSYNYTSFLVAIEVIRTASPVWPLGPGIPEFVCGRFECAHRLCNLRKNSIYSSTPLPAMLGASLGFRDVLSYFSQHQMSLDAFLNTVLSKEPGRGWLQHAAELLFLYYRDIWDSLPQAATVINFYHRHFLIMAAAHAAWIAHKKLADTATSGSERSSAESRAKEMDEAVARSAAALLFDLQNSCQQVLKVPGIVKSLNGAERESLAWSASETIDYYRARYSAIAQQSETAAEIELDKWLYNEAKFPVFWQDFVRGRTASLPTANQQ